jgi:hypothetical protein
MASRNALPPHRQDAPNGRPVVDPQRIAELKKIVARRLRDQEVAPPDSRLSERVRALLTGRRPRQ